MADETAQFEMAMRQIYDRARDELDYRPSAFLHMISEHGGVGTARLLLNRPVSQISDGFVRLQQEGRLDLSVEALVLDSRWQELFSDDQLLTARRRLKQAEYEFPAT